MTDAPERIWIEVFTDFQREQMKRLAKEPCDPSYMHEYIRADLHRAEVEAAVWRALDTALVRLILNLWRHEGGDEYSQGMDAGARHQHEQDVKAIRAIGADPETLRRIVEGGE